MQDFTIDHRCLVILKLYDEAQQAIVEGGPPRMPSQRDIVALINERKLDYPELLRFNIPLGDGETAKSKVVRAEAKLIAVGLVERPHGGTLTVTTAGRRLMKLLHSGNGDSVSSWPREVVVKGSLDSTVYHYQPEDPTAYFESPVIAPVFADASDEEE